MIIANEHGSTVGISLQDGGMLWRDNLKGLGYDNGYLLTAECNRIDNNAQPSHFDEFVDGRDV